MDTFSYILKDLMDANNLSQKHLAEKLGISESALSRYLNGERVPRLDILQKVSLAFGVTLDELTGNQVRSEDFPSVKQMVYRRAKNLSEKEKLELIEILTKNKGDDGRSKKA